MMRASLTRTLLAVAIATGLLTTGVGAAILTNSSPDKSFEVAGERGHALRTRADRQSRLKPLVSSASSRERMVNGWAARVRGELIQFSASTAWFDVILDREGRSLRAGSVCSFPIRRSVSGSSQRGRVRARPDPAGPGVRRREAA